jgi:hypothetical protein
VPPLEVGLFGLPTKKHRLATGMPTGKVDQTPFDVAHDDPPLFDLGNGLGRPDP